MPVSKFAKALTESVMGEAPFAVGDVVQHPDGRSVKIAGGSYWGEHGLSNFWEWNEVRADGSLGPKESGYGWQPERVVSRERGIGTRECGDGWRVEVLAELDRSQLSDRIRVFGSAATEGAEPKDIDVFVEVDPIADRAGIAQLLQIARRFYGQFDPFVLHAGKLHGNKLYTRSPEADGWVMAKNAAEIRAAGKAGVTIARAAEIAWFSAAPKPGM